ncbi:dienelactone hydrolase family protein [Microbacterium rhizophilus]|uniref:dienelactone hydrolase family protein n=1 Tax=Microbacterium rhizophilus TaxID=3138934 RepID=UPI0031EF4F74
MGTMINVAGLDVYRADPAGTPRGAVIVIEEIWGLVDHIKDVADRWAGEGYLAVAPDILTRVGITPEVGEELSQALRHPDEAVRTAMQPRLRDLLAPTRSPEYGAWATERLVALVDALAPEVDGKVAVTGFCFGGAYSFALAAADPRIRAAVPFYGTAPDPDRIVRIACPVLALYGQDDPRLVDALPEVREAMDAAGIDFTAVVYEGAGHAFFNDTNATAYRAEIAADAWGRATAFVAEHLA